MKKLLVLFIILTTSIYSYSQCTFTLTLRDSWTSSGLGWEGNRLFLTVNNVSVSGSPFTISTVGTPFLNFTFTANQGDLICCDFDTTQNTLSGWGSYSLDCSYEIKNPNGVIIFKDKGYNSGAPISGAPTSDNSDFADGCFVADCNISSGLPINDDPCGAINLPVGTSCNMQMFTSLGATTTLSSLAPNTNCSFNAEKDVWFKLTVPASGNLTIRSYEGVVKQTNFALYKSTSNSCSALQYVRCQGYENQSTCGGSANNQNDNTLAWLDIKASEGLANQTIWVRVWSNSCWSAGYPDAEGTFQICAYETPAAPIYTNACNAAPLTVNSSCVYQTFTNESAVVSASPSVNSCTGGYNSGGDVWFTVQVPASGRLELDFASDVYAGGYVAIYDALNCTSISTSNQIYCGSADNVNDGHIFHHAIGDHIFMHVEFMDYLHLAGKTLYVRFFRRANFTSGPFQICATEPTGSYQVDPVYFATNPQALVDTALIAGCATATNATRSGYPEQMGYFYGQAGIDIPFEKGVLLTNDRAVLAKGPNSIRWSRTSGLIFDHQTTGLTSMSAAPGDDDLSNLINDSTADASILEFDIIPQVDTLKFNYVFGSDEWPEYVTSPYSKDVFGMFLSGENPDGGNYDKFNMATIPGTTLPISVQNINNGVLNNGPAVNAQYYNFNSWGWQPWINPDETQYDGLTKKMTAWAKVTPCTTYHVKMAIADGGHQSGWGTTYPASTVNSGVFIETGQFIEPGKLTIKALGTNGKKSEEGCDICFVISRSDTTNLSLLVAAAITVSGTAVPDIASAVNPDYQHLPDSVFLQVGQKSDTICFSTFNDALTELMESVIVSLNGSCPCSAGSLNASTSDTAFVVEPSPFNLTSSDTSVCFGNPASLAIGGNNLDQYTYAWSCSSSTTSSASFSPVANSTCTVTVTNHCGKDTTLIFGIEVIPNLVADFTMSSDIINVGQTVDITFTGINSAAGNYTWSFDGGIVTPGIGIGPHSVYWESTGFKIVTLFIDQSGCSSTISKTIELIKIDEVIKLVVPTAFTPDGDFVNDVWEISTLDTQFPNNVVQVYNRWGSLLFESKPGKYETNSWNGKYNGEDLPVSSYYFIIEFNDNLTESMKGTVSIIKK